MYIRIHPNNVYICFLVNVRFSQSTYTVTESSGQLQATLILSRSLSANVTIQVKDSVSSAISKLLVQSTVFMPKFIVKGNKKHDHCTC